MAVKHSKTIVLGAACSAAALLVASGAHAQDAANPIDHCRETTNTDKDRIACLEAAIMGLMGTRETAQAETAPAAEPAAEPAGLGAEQVARRERDEKPAPRVAEAEKEPAESAEETQLAEAAPTGLGAEQVVARQERESDEGREKRKKRIRQTNTESRIIDFARTEDGRLILVLANGQVWAQRSSDSTNVRLREGDQPHVLIRRGALSGYRMEIDKPNRTIVVERLR